MHIWLRLRLDLGLDLFLGLGLGLGLKKCRRRLISEGCVMLWTSSGMGKVVECISGLGSGWTWA